MTSSPATSPNISISGSNMSPICSEEGPSVSPPLPPRLPPNMSDPTSRVPSSLTEHSQFLSDPSNLAALSYPRLGGGMMGLGASMPGLPYSSSEQNPYSSISMENFYNPLVGEIYYDLQRFRHKCPISRDRQNLSDFNNLSLSGQSL